MHDELNLAVVGGGLMGSGIAAKLASEGQRVTVFDNAEGASERVLNSCSETFRELIAGGVLDATQSQAALTRIEVTDDLGRLTDSDVIFEAIIESLEAKRALYQVLEDILSTQAIIASTTSGFTPSSLFTGLKNSDRALVTHFWNPPHLIPLVEVLASDWTDVLVVNETLQLLNDCGCAPVKLKKATPGFIGNRIQFAVLREALHLLQDEVADAETIDFVVRQTLGRRYRWIGPLEVADAGGLDTFLQIASHLMPQLCKDEEVLEILAKHVSRGHKGRLSMQGLMRWDDARKQNYQESRLKMMRFK